jgi:catechol 2,3-dioxygenase-like lactoylglutathione lyase family enzyme
MTILEIELLSDNLDATGEFYTNILGLEPESKDADHVSFRAGESILIFTRSVNLCPVYHFAFNIPKNTLDEAYIWISSRTSVIPVSETGAMADFTAWNAKAFYFYDNNGNILEMIAHFDLDNETNQPFTASVISGISEIAIVTEDVPRYTAQLSKISGIGVYEKQEPLPNFAALGDANGLFIISEEGRHWNPTNQPSHKFFTRVKFRNGDVVKELRLNETGDNKAPE